MSRVCQALILIALSLGSKLVAQQPPATAKVEVSPNYVLGPNDVISIKVFDEPELDTTLRIPEEGAVNFPLIGEITLHGKNVQQAAKLIRDRLAERYLVNPQVNVMVMEATKHLVTVLGQVQRPGTYRFPDRDALNLIQVIGIAGGYTRLADSSHVTVKRLIKQKETVFKLNAKKMASEQSSKAFEIMPGDIVIIGERIF